MHQNKKLGKILTKYVKQGGKLSSSDTVFAKKQFLDALKLLLHLNGLWRRFYFDEENPSIKRSNFSLKMQAHRNENVIDSDKLCLWFNSSLN